MKQHQLAKLEEVFDANPDHVAVEVGAYRHKKPGAGKKIFEHVIAQLVGGVPKDLPELVARGRTIMRRASDVVAFFARPGGLPAGRRRLSAGASRASAAPR